MIRKLITSTLISIGIFIILSIISYFISLEHEYNFEIGLPWKFYYQFMLDDILLHGTEVKYFTKDVFLVWTTTIILWFFVKRKQ
jgi:hypothetical protein